MGKCKGIIKVTKAILSDHHANSKYVRICFVGLRLSVEGFILNLELSEIEFIGIRNIRNILIWLALPCQYCPSSKFFLGLWQARFHDCCSWYLLSGQTFNKQMPL